jgi:tRNA (adenine37-N6)-methyltransferase
MIIWKTKKELEFMENNIVIKPIGVINTPYTEPKGIPIQGTFEKGITGTVNVFQEYQQGLKDLDGFSHAILLYYFNKSKEETLMSKPFLEDVEHGIFSIRSPHRPNHIGISVVKIEKVKDGIITFSEVDILDGTPLLDIKPYVSHFDHRSNVKNGWIDNHFKDAVIPERTVIK